MTARPYFVAKTEIERTVEVDTTLLRFRVTTASHVFVLTTHGGRQSETVLTTQSGYGSGGPQRRSSFSVFDLLPEIREIRTDGTLF